jgi:fluoride exporter
MWKSIAAISLGASLGALLRWQLSLRLNSLLGEIPSGTLLSNLVGGYIVGLAIGYFATSPQISPEWRLLIITGFCGGLTTFSTFSAEILAMLQAGRPVLAAAAIGVHVVGSLLMTLAGFLTFSFFKAAA